VDDDIQIPGPRLISAYPNPMKDELTLRIGKSESSQTLAHINVYNLRGQLIRVLPVTQDEARWAGRDINGKACPAGVYLIRDAAKTQAMQKITLLK
jgi:flagellar hook assembly protein FlgD